MFPLLGKVDSCCSEHGGEDISCMCLLHGFGGKTSEGTNAAYASVTSDLLKILGSIFQNAFLIYTSSPSLSVLHTTALLRENTGWNHV